jgi:hypothetical protein
VGGINKKRKLTFLKRGKGCFSNQNVKPWNMYIVILLCFSPEDAAVWPILFEQFTLAACAPVLLTLDVPSALPTSFRPS